MTTEQTIAVETREHVMLIGLNRPSKRNAFTMAMLHALSNAFSEYERDDSLWCALLFAHGDHFTGGLDLAEVGPAVARGEPLLPEGGIDPMGLTDPRRTKPLVTAAQGWCVTIGVELMLASDIRLAAQGTRFTQLEVSRGLMPFGGATLRLPQIAGWGNAMRHLLTGDTFDADEAYRIGLVQEVVPPEQLLDRGIELAEQVARQAPRAVQASLASARVALEQGSTAAIAQLMEQTRALMATQDAREGMMSFLERREARFTGT